MKTTIGGPASRMQAAQAALKHRMTELQQQLGTGDQMEKGSNKIEIVPLNHDLRTAYISGSRGQTRERRNGRELPPPSANRLLRVGQANPSAWKACTWVADAIESLDKALRDAGADGVRLVDVTRSGSYQRNARAEFEAGRKPYVARVNESNHQWGGAIDDDVKALRFRVGGKTIEGSEALGIYWELARPLGFSPVISRPSVNQAEAWHFDVYGPLGAVKRQFRVRGEEDRKYANDYGLTAQVGCILAGTFLGTRLMYRFVQARLLIGGFWCGLPDGHPGPKTRAALAAAGVSDARAPDAELVGALDELGVGLKQVRTRSV